MRVIVCIEDPLIIGKILQHLDPQQSSRLWNTLLPAQSRRSGVRLIAGFAGHEVQSASITAIRSVW